MSHPLEVSPYLTAPVRTLAQAKADRAASAARLAAAVERNAPARETLTRPMFGVAISIPVFHAFTDAFIGTRTVEVIPCRTEAEQAAVYLAGLHRDNGYGDRYFERVVWTAEGWARPRFQPVASAAWGADSADEMPF